MQYCVYLLPFSGANRIWIRCGRSGVSQVLSPFLFNSYMKFICCHGMKYHHYADDIQLHISSLDELNSVVGVLSQGLETLEV